ncbi:hypothetical protein D5086_025088 [Populus alba]|uniref:Uncharacterized protein n=1 Tax=Populus alba TaxID=43335 RepID=A0ACC4B7B9_POPAL
MATIFRPQALPVNFYYGVPSVLMLESCFWFSKLCLFGVVGFALFPGRVFFLLFYLGGFVIRVKKSVTESKWVGEGDEGVDLPYKGKWKEFKV